MQPNPQSICAIVCIYVCFGPTQRLLPGVLAVDIPMPQFTPLISFLNSLYIVPRDGGSACHVSFLVRHDHALEVNREVVDLYRKLAADRPSTFNACLASSLISLSCLLAHLGL